MDLPLDEWLVSDLTEGQDALLNDPIWAANADLTSLADTSMTSSNNEESPFDPSSIDLSPLQSLPTGTSMDEGSSPALSSGM